MLTFLLYYAIIAQNMNGNIYYISNPNTSSVKQYSTIFNSEYFDVFSPPISSRYGDVFWTVMDPVPLPQHIIDRFNNKPMPIVGYEMNQLFLDNTSVPITWAYNHHYAAYLYESEEDFKVLPHNIQKLDLNNPGSKNHGFHSFVKINESLNKYPSSQFFSEGNGGESRASYHGYPNGFAQIIFSPKIFRIQPMQIDTRNRNPKFINQSKFIPGILPPSVASPPNASYSGLLECPCTNRKTKQISKDYYSSNQAKCIHYISNSSECYQKLNYIKHNISFKNFSNQFEIQGCFINNTGGYFNSYKSHLGCQNTKNINQGNVSLGNVSLQIRIGNQLVYLNMSGPKDVWFGTAYNASQMADLPYSIIVLGNGTVQEWKLGDHSMGTLLSSSVRVLRNNVIGSIRSVELVRNVSNKYYDFRGNMNIPILIAEGNTPTFGYHRYRGSTKMYLYSLQGNTCLCYDGVSGSINGIPFRKKCAAEPIADLLKQNNPSCFIDTYQGGLSCCSHKSVLLNQEQIQPKHEMTYRIKFRFWFQDFQNHQNLIRLYFQTEAYSGEYDVPKAPYGTPYENTVHSITARFQIKDMVDSKYQKNHNGIKFITAAPHCHAPTCISMELYNADTGQLICGVYPKFGQGRSNVKFDELDYIRIDPCIWGMEEGLMNPDFFTWDTNLTSIKKNNNTYAHYGEMASWQCRGILI
tara:strand:- start:1921 stop:3999 length:2079 start_codon:yes stop_codon:yes gene_type:complete